MSFALLLSRRTQALRRRRYFLDGVNYLSQGSLQLLHLCFGRYVPVAALIPGAGSARLRSGGGCCRGSGGGGDRTGAVNVVRGAVSCSAALTTLGTQRDDVPSDAFWHSSFHQVR